MISKCIRRKQVTCRIERKAAVCGQLMLQSNKMTLNIFHLIMSSYFVIFPNLRIRPQTKINYKESNVDCHISGKPTIDLFGNLFQTLQVISHCSVCCTFRAGRLGP